MRQVIEGLIYDTNTAQLIGEADNLGHGVDSVSDFGYWTASLHVTQNGRFFLAGEGGPASMFAEPAGQNSRRGGNGIRPMSRDSALGWAELWLNSREIEENFELEEA